MSSAQKEYSRYLRRGTLKVVSKAEYLIALDACLIDLGVHLFWPDPPFDEDFEESFQSQYEFQIHWAIRILECSNELSSSERNSITVPHSPYTSTGIMAFVDAHKNCIQNRSVWHRWQQFMNGLSAEEQKRLLKLKEWVGKDKGDFDLEWSKKSRLVEYWSNITVMAPAGTFMMGALEGDDLAKENEYPRHEVCIDSPLEIMKHPVTIEQYQKVMKRWYLGHGRTKELDHPVHRVSWIDAIQFANHLSIECGLTPVYIVNEKEISIDIDANGWRLPTESEWEYCARGGEYHLYAGSDSASEVAWYNGDQPYFGTHPVAWKAANGFGLYDMSGNVWEWCWNSYEASYQSAEHNSMTAMRVVRGGDFKSSKIDIRVSCRKGHVYIKRDAYIGFRLLRYC